jgi:hypothetical protein
MALYLHGYLLKNIMKIQAKIEAWNREFEEFMILKRSDTRRSGLPIHLSTK